MKRVKKTVHTIASIVEFFFFYAKELVLASFQVAHDVLTFHLHIRPGIIAVPLDIKRDVSLLIFSNLLTMTPGSLALDISTDRKTIYVHVLFLDPDLEKNRRRIKHTFERRIRRLFEDE